MIMPFYEFHMLFRYVARPCAVMRVSCMLVLSICEYKRAVHKVCPVYIGKLYISRCPDDASELRTILLLKIYEVAAHVVLIGRGSKRASDVYNYDYCIVYYAVFQLMLTQYARIHIHLNNPVCATPPEAEHVFNALGLLTEKKQLTRERLLPSSRAAAALLLLLVW